MKTGTAKQKKVFQFYQEMIKSGQRPLPYREPQLEQPRKPLDTRFVLHLPDPDGERWAWRWDGEDYELWEERLRLGYLDWYRYIDSVKNSKKPDVRANVSFYVSLMREERFPVPVENWQGAKKLGTIREQMEWIEQTKSEIPTLIPAWRAWMMQRLDTPPIPMPSDLREWQRKWWRQCWEEFYRPYRDEDRMALQRLRNMKSAQRELELLEKGEAELHRLNMISVEQLRREYSASGGCSELVREADFRRIHFCEEGCDEQRVRDMRTDRRSKRDKLIFQAQIPGGQLELSKLSNQELREKIMLVNRARAFSELTVAQAEREMGLREELRKRAEAGV
jgi:NADH:ubiquinone oxidoreductase subunit